MRGDLVDSLIGLIPRECRTEVLMGMWIAILVGVAIVATIHEIRNRQMDKEEEYERFTRSNRGRSRKRVH